MKMTVTHDKEIEYKGEFYDVVGESLWSYDKADKTFFLLDYKLEVSNTYDDTEVKKELADEVKEYYIEEVVDPYYEQEVQQFYYMRDY